MKNTKNESIDKRKPVDLGVLVFLVYFAITFAIISYVWWFLFRHNSDLSTDSAVWGSFGDYFNGFVSPVVGFVTVVLIFRAYRTQEREFSETTKSLKIQIEQSKIAIRRDMLWKSAAQVYAEIIDKWTPEYQESIKTKVLLCQIDKFDSIIKVLKKDYLPLLLELASYLSAVDVLTEHDTKSTDFYRRRISNRFKYAREICAELDEALKLFVPLDDFNVDEIPVTQPSHF